MIKALSNFTLENATSYVSVRRKLNVNRVKSFVRVFLFDAETTSNCCLYIFLLHIKPPLAVNHRQPKLTAGGADATLNVLRSVLYL